MPDQTQIIQINSNSPALVYKPSEVLNIFATFLSQQSVNKKVIYLCGIYLKSQNHNPQWQFRYDSLRDENNQSEITLQIPYRLCEDLKDGSLVTVRGVLERRMVPKQGHIQIMLNVSEIDIVQEQAIDEDEIQRMEIRRQKAQRGFKNVDSILEQLLFMDQRPRIALLFATTSITMSDFNAGIQAAKSAIDFVEFRANFSNSAELTQRLTFIDQQNFDVIALIRGGGGGIESLDDLGVLQTVSNLHIPVIAAVGHVEEKLVIKQVVDKEVAVPASLGHYFADMVERVSEEKSKSRAVLMAQIKKEYQEHIEKSDKRNKELNEQLTAMRKMQGERDKKHAEEMAAQRKQLAAIQKENAEQQEKQNKAQQELQNQLKQQLKASDDRSKELNESLGKLQRTNSELQRSLSQLTAQNTQTARDLNAAKDHARELQRQLDELRNKKNRGCFGVVIGAVAITAATFASLCIILF